MGSFLLIEQKQRLLYAQAKIPKDEVIKKSNVLILFSVQIVKKLRL